MVIAAFAAVVVFFPAEGRVLVPLHTIVDELLGQAAFLLPLGLTLIGVLALVRRMFPGYSLPGSRLAGVAVLAIALLVGEPLLGDSTGLIGDWLTGFLTELLGAPITGALTLVLVAAGIALLFDVKIKRRSLAAS